MSMKNLLLVLLAVGVLGGCGSSAEESVRSGTTRPIRVPRPANSATAQTSTTVANPAPGDTEAVVVAAGDIACDPHNDDFNRGDGTSDGCHHKATSNLVEQIRPDAVLVLGDIQYERGTPENYFASYDPTWGRFKGKTYPVLGNHEGGEGGSNEAYFEYFGGRAGSPDEGYYSFDVGQWHVIALNSNCGEYLFNGSDQACVEGSAQDRWLKADLAAHRTACTLAYFHVPRFSNGKEHHSDASNPTLTALWNDLYAGGVDVILNGHNHDYERFAPLTPQGTVDEQRGIRQFVVGTGGDNLQAFGSLVGGTEVRNKDSYGVLKLTLRPSAYAWQFINDGSPGATNNDHGTAACHT